GEPLEQQHLAARPLEPDPGRHHSRVVDDDERLRRQLLRQVAEDPVARLPAAPRPDEEPRRVPPRRPPLGHQLRPQLVVGLGCLHPTATLPSQVMDDRYSLPPDVAAALERARLQVEALAQTADELQIVLPDAVGNALREGLREEAAPISRRLAEVKGLSN